MKAINNNEFNCDLSKDIAYVNMINNIIKEEKIAYALPMYNIDFVTNHEIDNDILFKISFYKSLWYK